MSLVDVNQATGGDAPRRGRRSKRGASPTGKRESARKTNYSQLKNPFAPVPLFSEDRIEAIHETSLRVLEELGIKVLLPEARELYRKAGAVVHDDTNMVHIGREIIEATLATAPKSFEMVAGRPEHNLTMELGSLTIQTGGAAPHANDLVRGRRPGSLQDYTELTRLTQKFDALHMLNPLVEAQDIPIHVRHYAVTRTQLTVGDKLPFIFSRGTPQVRDAFEMIRIARGVSEEDFSKSVYTWTIVNTNSPRVLDVPMAQGLIDFARAGQMSIVTPFCLMGAMAPISIAGALTLSHAEALAGIALVQLAKPGAPVCYGSFQSNVDMKSGAPVFGTPEHFKATLAAGQMARKLGLPWRAGGGSAGNCNDAQAAHETQMSVWGAVLAGATIIIHAAGWLEGGLTVHYEKLITDMEAMQVFAELCANTPSDDAELAFDAIADVAPSGHFFATGHTMERYQTAFYEPLVADWSNFGTWTERGSKDVNERATALWQRMLAEEDEVFLDPARTEELDAFIAKRTDDGGAPPES